MSATTWMADVLVVIGLLFATAAVAGIVRLPAAFARIHAAALAVAAGVGLVLLACVLAQPAAMAARALLVGAFVLLTSPVGSHALARLRLARDRAASDESAPESGARTEARA